MNRFASVGIAALLLALFSSGAAAQSLDVPAALAPWSAWVMHGEEYRRCPLRNDTDEQDSAAFECRWPGRLSISVDETGGTFSQRWQTYAEEWITLPGDETHWPEAVTVDGAAAAIVAHAGTPRLRLPSGGHEVRGRFVWSRRPESLRVASTTALVDLSIDGRRIAPVEIRDARLWLGAVQTLEQPRALDVQIYRLLQDGSPVRLTTELQLRVSGEAREELLARVLPDGVVPLTTSGGLPFRFEPDGRVRVQVRSGEHRITIVARAPTGTSRFALPSDAGVAASDEIWSYRADDRLRITAIEGAQTIDPVHAAVPMEWRDAPTYRLQRGATLAIGERSRGLNRQDANRLTLRRDLWLAFDRTTFDAVDHVSGTMQQGWRLDMRQPYRLLTARGNDDETLLITNAAERRTGIEVRTPTLNVMTLSRVDRDGALPATGWDARFENVTSILHLPPGHRLLAAWGVDRSPGAWLDRWKLLDLFLLLLVTVAAYRLLGWSGGAVAATALLLTHHETGAPSWLWINTVLAVAIARVMPEGKLRTWFGAYRTASIAVLALVLLPFAITQYRLALHPQLEVAQEMPIAAIAEQPFGLEAKRTSLSEVLMPQVDLQLASPPPIAMEMPAPAYVPRQVEAPIALDRYAPDATLQTGPGTPDWRFVTYALDWSGPVDAAQTVRLTILSPLWVSLWRIGGLVFSALLLLALVRLAYDVSPQWTLPRFGRTASLVALLATCSTAISLAPQRALAQTPDAQLLTELKQRLSRPAACAPRCAEIVVAKVHVEGDRLAVDLEVHAQASVALGIPHAGTPWIIERVAIDERTIDALARRDDVLELPVAPGVHRIEMLGRIAAADELALEFPTRPRRIVVQAQGWTFAGTSEGRLLNNALQLTRRLSAGASNATLAPQRLPAFVRVHRRVFMNLDWTMTTRVQRLAPNEGAFTLRLPLLPGEGVLTPGYEVRDRSVLVSMPAGEDEVEWRSSLARVDRLQWIAASEQPWVEQWDVVVAPMWHAEFTGTPAILLQEVVDGRWVNQFLPRSGEALDISVVRPTASAGTTLAVDRVDLRSRYGERLMSSTLEFSYRTSRGGRHDIRIPADARVQSIMVDGQSLPLRPEQGVLPLTLAPGAHTVKVEFSRDAGASIVTRPPTVDIGADGTNVRTSIMLDADRWVLLASGDGVGTAVMYWSELALFIVLALLLGRIGGTPLRTRDWLLLGLGLSTFSWWVLLVFATWIFLLAHRARWNPASRFKFNALQIGLAVASAVALVVLVSAIPFGLLGAPNMGLRPDPTYDGLTWFLDRTGPTLSQPFVISVSIWFYKAAMLLWALWLSFALVRWLPWVWDRFSCQGLWRPAAQATA